MTQTTPPTPRVLIPILKDGKSYMVAKNPHREYDEFCVDQDIQWSKNPRWADFHKSNPPIPCIDGFTPEDREYSEDEVEVVWQYLAYDIYEGTPYQQIEPGTWLDCQNDKPLLNQTRRVIRPKHPTQQEINKEEATAETFTRTEVISIVDAVLKRVVIKHFNSLPTGELDAFTIVKSQAKFNKNITELEYLDLLEKKGRDK